MKSFFTEHVMATVQTMFCTAYKTRHTLQKHWSSNYILENLPNFFILRNKRSWDRQKTLYEINIELLKNRSSGHRCLKGLTYRFPWQVKFNSVYTNYLPRVTLWIAFAYKQTHLLTCKILDEWEDRKVGPCNRAQNIQTSCAKIIQITWHKFVCRSHTAAFRILSTVYKFTISNIHSNPPLNYLTHPPTARIQLQSCYFMVILSSTKGKGRGKSTQVGESSIANSGVEIGRRGQSVSIDRRGSCPSGYTGV